MAGPRWRNNPGHMPQSLKGKRVIVELRNGDICGEKPIASGAPAGWAADGRGGLRWSLTGDPFDVVRYKAFVE